MARRALSIGVSGFERHDRLDFAPGLVRRLAKALGDLGCDVDEVASETLPGDRLGSLVTGARADDLAVVHLVSPGERADGGATVSAPGGGAVPGQVDIHPRRAGRGRAQR